MTWPARWSVVHVFLLPAPPTSSTSQTKSGRFLKPKPGMEAFLRGWENLCVVFAALQTKVPNFSGVLTLRRQVIRSHPNRRSDSPSRMRDLTNQMTNFDSHWMPSSKCARAWASYGDLKSLFCLLKTRRSKDWWSSAVFLPSLNLQKIALPPNFCKEIRGQALKNLKSWRRCCLFWGQTLEIRKRELIRHLW